MAEEQRRDRDREMEALKYERDMLHHMATVVFSGVADRSPMGNALQESFLIHARVLIGFLYGQPRKGYDDILAEHFLEPGEWERIRPEQTQLMKDTKHDADKYLAHLTTTRLDQKKKWDYPTIFNEINGVLDVFDGHVKAR